MNVELGALMQKKPKSPCMPGCPDRILGCRQTCEKWQEYERLEVLFEQDRQRAYHALEDYYAARKARQT